MVNRNQKGYVLPVVIILITTLAVLSIGLLPNITAQIRFNRMDEDRLIAQYAAEAGAKTALRQIQQTYNSYADNNSGTVTIADILSINSANTTPENFVYHPDKAKYSSYTVQFAPDNITDPKKIQVTANGFFNGKRYTVRPFFSLELQRTGGIKELFKDCEYSHLDGKSDEKLQEWELDTTTANPPPGNNFYQVLFKGCQLESQFSLAYNASCEKYVTGSPSGYGIYYGATGDADNMTSYVFQYDPGAEYMGDEGSFFVKKVKKSADNPKHASDNEWVETTTTTLINSQINWFNLAPITTYSDPVTQYFGTKVTVTQTKKVITKKIITTYQIKSEGQYRNKLGLDSYVPLQGTVTNEYGKPEKFINGTPGDEDTYRVSLRDLKAYMEEQTGISNFKIDANHKITITVCKDDKGELRHQIYCDDVKILDFVDKTVTCPITFKGSHSGLRVWNAKVGFYDYPNDSYGQGTRPVIWTK
jgi:type II secretory pathway pseudopilin PulG